MTSTAPDDAPLNDTPLNDTRRTETGHTDTPPTDTGYTDAGYTDTPATDTGYSNTPGTETGRPPLRRSRTDLYLGGVCAGLARHTGIDALLWRVGFAALVLAGGSGVALYLVLWLLMPAAPAGPTDRTNVLDEWVERLRARFTRPKADIAR